MVKSAVRPTDDEIEETVRTYSNMIYKLCFTMLGNISDAEDAVSDTILRYIEKYPDLKDNEHKKAWLLHTAANICRDKHRFFKRHSYVNLDDVTNICIEEREQSIIEYLLMLPEKYKAVIHLFYIEGYKTGEIAKMLRLSSDAVRKRLQVGRQILKSKYERDK